MKRTKESEYEGRREKGKVFSQSLLTQLREEERAEYNEGR